MKTFVVFLVLVLAVLACKTGPTPQVPADTPTPVIVEVTSRVFVEITTTPATVGKYLCVIAVEAVYLRPSPGATHYPLMPLERGTMVKDTLTRDGNWIFVEYEDKAGWIHEDYLGECR